MHRNSKSSSTSTTTDMPVYRFRNIQECERSGWYRPGDPRIWQALERRWAIHQALGKEKKLASGVRKFRSIEEKQRCESEEL